MWQKEKLHILCNFFFCHYVLKKPSAAEASERDIQEICGEKFKSVYESIIFVYKAFQNEKNKNNYWIGLKALWQKEKMLIISNFFIYHKVFKSSAAELSESVCMRERDKSISFYFCIQIIYFIFFLKNYKYRTII